MDNNPPVSPNKPSGVLKLKIIGNGGAVNHLLPHNCALLNSHFLVDCPPDIIHSLQTLDIHCSDIDMLYISHFHGDHTFGFPFFVLHKWIGRHASEGPAKLAVYGPKGIRNYLLKLTEMAWGKEHPCYHWVETITEFEEVRQGMEIDYRTFKMSLFRMEHIRNTFGFTLTDPEGIPRFSYMSDTRWCRGVANELRKKPWTVLIDINGGPSGMHLSYEEVIEHGLKITEQATRYLGTHIGQAWTSSHARIQVVNQGDEYDL